jgi:hypothetical protein
MNFNEYTKQRTFQLNKAGDEKDKSQVIKNLLSENIQENIIHEIAIALDNTTNYFKNGTDGPGRLDGTPSVLSIAQAFHKNGLGPIDSSVIDDLIINHVSLPPVISPEYRHVEEKMNKLLPLIKYLNPKYVPSKEAREIIEYSGEGFVNKVVAASRESTGLLTRVLERMSNINLPDIYYNGAGYSKDGMTNLAYHILGAGAIGAAIGAAASFAPATALASIALPTVTGTAIESILVNTTFGMFAAPIVGVGHLTAVSAVKSMSNGLNYIRKTLDHTFTNVDNILKAADKQSATLKIIEQEQEMINQNNTNQNVQQEVIKPTNIDSLIENITPKQTDTLSRTVSVLTTKIKEIQEIMNMKQQPNLPSPS